MKYGALYRAIKQAFGEVGSFSGFFIVLLSAIFFGWFPDSLKEIISETYPGVNISALTFGLSFFTLLMLFLSLNWVIRRIAHIRYEVETYDAMELKKVKVLITGLSVPRQHPELGHNWSQQEVLIKTCLQHNARLEKVVIVPSKDSARYEQEFLDFMKERLGVSPSLFSFEEPVSYEDLLGLQVSFQRTLEKLKREGFKERNIIIDITAGTKTFSVVASSLTFDNSIRMCYVNNAKQVVVFDMVAIKED